MAFNNQSVELNELINHFAEKYADIIPKTMSFHIDTKHESGIPSAVKNKPHTPKS